MGRYINDNAQAVNEEPEAGFSPDSPASFRPDIYPGSPASFGPVSGIPGKKRRIIRQRVSPFTVVLLLLAAAIAIVLYIGNIIAVDQLLAEINALETQHRHILMEQEILRAQINKMASLERIQELAEKDVGLIIPKEPPVWLNIDENRVKKVEEAAQKR